MKKSLFILVLMTISVCLSAQTPKYVYTEASDLNLIGKIIDTPNPYHRVDTVKYKGFTEGENIQVRCSAGLAVLFKTDSKSISLKPEYGYTNHATNTMGLALRGYDLYIRKDGKWLYAESMAPSDKNLNKEFVIIKDMPEGVKECMLYLPIYSELYSLGIGVEEGTMLESLESPFRHRIGIFGSSFTHGISTSRSGMSYPMQLMRWTGLQFLSLGCSGNCKMQPYFGEVLCDADVDAFVFDAFSNPNAKMIEERLFPFIEQLQKAHPDTPLIFQQTIRRESRNFSTRVDKSEQAKQEMAAKLMKQACRKYRNVYFIEATDAADKLQETSVDGTHPGDYGYTLWAKSIEKPLLKILKKHGIR
ncbi:MAG: hypothetical protein E7116_02070 [Bacteroidales bacterium]|nr:hypothetical protein [Bacteroidales bacterium]